MTDSQQKRPIELEENSSSNKRQKPYNIILSLLELEEEELDFDFEPSREPSQDLSAIYKTLQRELSNGSTFDFDSVQSTAKEESALTSGDGVESVMRHLLEASDDELGIPNIGGDNDNIDKVRNDVENFSCGFSDNYGLWEFDDEAANYYSALQSEFFI